MCHAKMDPSNAMPHRYSQFIEPSPEKRQPERGLASHPGIGPHLHGASMQNEDILKRWLLQPKQRSNNTYNAQSLMRCK